MTELSHSQQFVKNYKIRRDKNRNSRRESSHRTDNIKAKRTKLSQVNQVPVMVRGDGFGIPIQRTKRIKARQRINLALDIPGAEIKLPALPTIQLGWRLASFLFSVILLALIYLAWTTSFFTIQGVKISGLKRLSEHDLNVVLEITGKQIFVVNPESLEKKISKAFPEFISVNVEASLPNVVEIFIEERVPILLWKQEGKSVLVDASGYAFPLRDATNSEKAIVVSANSPPPSLEVEASELEQMQFLPVDMVSAILSMSAIIPPDTSIIYDSQHGFGWKDDKGWEVYFGNVQDISAKLNIYQTLTKKLKQESIKPVFISIEFVNAPYYRMEQ